MKNSQGFSVVRSSKFKKMVFAYCLLIPFLFGFFAFFIRPLGMSAYYSANSITLSGSTVVYTYQGIENYYNALFVDTNFRNYLLTSMKDLAINVPIILFFSLFVATILNKNFVGKNFSRIVLFLPVIITTGVLLSLESSDYLMGSGTNALKSGVEQVQTYATSTGIKDLMLSLKLPSQITTYINDIVTRFYTILTTSGVQITLQLAALQSISPNLYEASAIEGATAWEEFWKITVPMVSPYIFVCCLYTVIDTFTSPNNQLVTYIKKVATGSSMDYGLSSAMSWIYFMIIAVVLALISILFLRSRFVVYQNK